MRTSIVGLTRLDDREHTAAAARAIAELTHADPLALDSSVLWSDAVRRAVLFGHLDLTAGLDFVDSKRRGRWAAWVAEATGADPARFAPNGFTVAAIAGGLLGARYGASAVPVEWASAVHGWPGLRGADLVDLGRATAQPPTAGQSGAHPPGAHAPRADR
jgi:hypothetical protein